MTSLQTCTGFKVQRSIFQSRSNVSSSDWHTYCRGWDLSNNVFAIVLRQRFNFYISWRPLCTDGLLYCPQRDICLKFKCFTHNTWHICFIIQLTYTYNKKTTYIKWYVARLKHITATIYCSSFTNKSNLHTTLYALYHEAIAQPLQPQATLFKISIEVGSNYAYSLEIYLVYIGVPYIFCQRIRAHTWHGE